MPNLLNLLPITLLLMQNFYGLPYQNHSLVPGMAKNGTKAVWTPNKIPLTHADVKLSFQITEDAALKLKNIASSFGKKHLKRLGIRRLKVGQEYSILSPLARAKNLIMGVGETHSLDLLHSNFNQTLKHEQKYIQTLHNSMQNLGDSLIFDQSFDYSKNQESVTTVIKNEYSQNSTKVHHTINNNVNDPVLSSPLLVNLLQKNSCTTNSLVASINYIPPSYYNRPDLFYAKRPPNLLFTNDVFKEQKYSTPNNFQSSQNALKHGNKNSYPNAGTQQFSMVQSKILQHPEMMDVKKFSMPNSINFGPTVNSKSFFPNEEVVQGYGVVGSSFTPKSLATPLSMSGGSTFVSDDGSVVLRSHNTAIGTANTNVYSNKHYINPPNVYYDGTELSKNNGKTPYNYVVNNTANPYHNPNMNRYPFEMVPSPLVHSTNRQNPSLPYNNYNSFYNVVNAPGQKVSSAIYQPYSGYVNQYDVMNNKTATKNMTFPQPSADTSEKGGSLDGCVITTTHYAMISSTPSCKTNANNALFSCPVASEACMIPPPNYHNQNHIMAHGFINPPSGDRLNPYNYGMAEHFNNPQTIRPSAMPSYNNNIMGNDGIMRSMNRNYLPTTNNMGNGGMFENNLSTYFSSINNHNYNNRNNVHDKTNFYPNYTNNDAKQYAVPHNFNNTVTSSKASSTKKRTSANNSKKQTPNNVNIVSTLESGSIKVPSIENSKKGALHNDRGIKVQEQHASQVMKNDASLPGSSLSGWSGMKDPTTFCPPNSAPLMYSSNNSLNKSQAVNYVPPPNAIYPSTPMDYHLVNPQNQRQVYNTLSSEGSFLPINPDNSNNNIRQSTIPYPYNNNPQSISLNNNIVFSSSGIGCKSYVETNPTNNFYYQYDNNNPNYANPSYMLTSVNNQAPHMHHAPQKVNLDYDTNHTNHNNKTVSSEVNAFSANKNQSVLTNNSSTDWLPSVSSSNNASSHETKICSANVNNNTNNMSITTTKNLSSVGIGTSSTNSSQSITTTSDSITLPMTTSSVCTTLSITEIVSRNLAAIKNAMLVKNAKAVIPTTHYNPNQNNFSSINTTFSSNQQSFNPTSTMLPTALTMYQNYNYTDNQSLGGYYHQNHVPHQPPQINSSNFLSVYNYHGNVSNGNINTTNYNNVVGSTMYNCYDTQKGLGSNGLYGENIQHSIPFNNSKNNNNALSEFGANNFGSLNAYTMVDSIKNTLSTDFNAAINTNAKTNTSVKKGGHIEDNTTPNRKHTSQTQGRPDSNHNTMHVNVKKKHSQSQNNFMNSSFSCVSKSNTAQYTTANISNDSGNNYNNMNSNTTISTHSSNSIDPNLERNLDDTFNSVINRCMMEKRLEEQSLLVSSINSYSPTIINPPANINAYSPQNIFTHPPYLTSTGTMCGQPSNIFSTASSLIVGLKGSSASLNELLTLHTTTTENTNTCNNTINSAYQNLQCTQSYYSPNLANHNNTSFMIPSSNIMQGFSSTIPVLPLTDTNNYMWTKYHNSLSSSSDIPNVMVTNLNTLAPNYMLNRPVPPPNINDMVNFDINVSTNVTTSATTIMEPQILNQNFNLITGFGLGSNPHNHIKGDGMERALESPTDRHKRLKLDESQNISSPFNNMINTVPTNPYYEKDKNLAGFNKTSYVPEDFMTIPSSNRSNPTSYINNNNNFDGFNKNNHLSSYLSSQDAHTTLNASSTELNPTLNNNLELDSNLAESLMLGDVAEDYIMCMDDGAGLLDTASSYLKHQHSSQNNINKIAEDVSSKHNENDVLRNHIEPNECLITGNISTNKNIKNAINNNELSDHLILNNHVLSLNLNHYDNTAMYPINNQAVEMFVNDTLHQQMTRPLSSLNGSKFGITANQRNSPKIFDKTPPNNCLPPISPNAFNDINHVMDYHEQILPTTL